ncbi:MAG: RagB/SusD family nutrient uptake outer membrane protein [Fulvivirga sp.]
MKKLIYNASLVLAIGFLSGCTDLEVEEMDSIVIESESGEFSGVDAVATLASAYTDLRGFASQEHTYALHEVTSDELLVPTRGTDWGDNGIWRTLHQHSWDASHFYILSSWNALNSNVFKLNQLLAPETGASAQQLAEGKFLRAYNMYLILDLYGQIPFRGVHEGVDVNPQVLNATEAFDFILNDLTEALPDLPERDPSMETINASQASANFLLAKLYLNKHVFIGGEPAAEDMNKVIEAVDAIAADGFVLYDNYFDIFRPYNDPSDPDRSLDTETIFYTDADYATHIWSGLHYNQGVPGNAAGGWNGFSTTADFYALFEGSADSNEPGNNQEERRGFVPVGGEELAPEDDPEIVDEDGDGIVDGSYLGYGFLFGQQYGVNGDPLTDRAGNPLVYTKEFPGLAGNNERTGIRVLKYHPEEGAFGNHYILFRYGDAHLMKAEAIARGGTSSETALGLVNQLREVREATPLTTLTLEDILDERGRELYIEGWRRNDQIRFGTYTEPWDMKDNTEAHRVLFPIPITALTTNPNLVQNPGY